MNSKRIFYIDALKAFAIVLVVMGHMSFVWTTNTHKPLYPNILSIFHMPLFMALSGYVLNADKFQMSKKAKLLIPFFAFGMIWTIVNQLSFFGFFEHEAKYGYWFLYVLFMFFVFLSIIRAVGRNLYGSMVIVEVILMGLHAMFHRTIPGTIMSTDHMFQLWPFFCLGIIMKRGLITYLYSHKILSAISCLAGVCLIGGVKISLHLTSTLGLYCNDVMALFIVPFLFLLFHEMEIRMRGKDSRAKKGIKYLSNKIGQNTLQIYVLQYFAIKAFQLIFADDINPKYVMYEWWLSPILAILISYLCVVVSDAMHKLRLGFLFGR